MPIYEYIAEDQANACRVCARGFELMRELSQPPLENCPVCRRPVKKLISQVNTPKVSKPLSVSDAKSKGFTILQKRDKGVYEKL